MDAQNICTGVHTLHVHCMNSEKCLQGAEIVIWKLVQLYKEA